MISLIYFYYTPECKCCYFKENGIFSENLEYNESSGVHRDCMTYWLYFTLKPILLGLIKVLILIIN